MRRAGLAIFWSVPLPPYLALSCWLTCSAEVISWRWSGRKRNSPNGSNGGMAPPLLLPHQAPFGDHGLAHLAGIAGAGDLVDLDRDLLADERLQLPGLRVAGGDEL